MSKNLPTLKFCVQEKVRDTSTPSNMVCIWHKLKSPPWTHLDSCFVFAKLWNFPISFKIRKDISFSSYKQSHTEKILVGHPCFSLLRPIETWTRFSEVPIRPKSNSHTMSVCSKQGTLFYFLSCTSHTGKNQKPLGFYEASFCQAEGMWKRNAVATTTKRTYLPDFKINSKYKPKGLLLRGNHISRPQLSRSYRQLKYLNLFPFCSDITTNLSSLPSFFSGDAAHSPGT